jgi:hypothetical protein
MAKTSVRRNLLDRAVKLRNSIKTLFQSKRQRAGKVLQKIIRAIRAVPGWIVSRPAAFKAWQKQDKKKKKYRSFRLQKRIKPEVRLIPTSMQLLKDSAVFLWRKKGLFSAIIIVHALIYITVARTPQTIDIATIQESLQSAFVESDSELSTTETTLSTLGAVIGLTGGSQAKSTAMAITMLLVSLVYIWAIRQTLAGQKVKMRDAYYQGPTPLAGVLIVLFMLSLQLIPFAAASFVYGTARSGGLFASGFEDLAFFVITALVALGSLYWITSTIIALYVVTLPGMYPMQALRAAKKLVQFQRFLVFKRLLFLPVCIGVGYVLLLLFSIRFIPSGVFYLAESFQLLSLPFIHVYIYKLYRSLI